MLRLQIGSPIRGALTNWVCPATYRGENDWLPIAKTLIPKLPPRSAKGKRGVELYPVSKDALIGPKRVRDLAVIYTMVGEYDAALDEIEYLLSIPSWYMSVPRLRLDPIWDPLRDHPRFQALLEKYGD